MRQWPFVFAFMLSHAHVESALAPLLGTEVAPVHQQCARATARSVHVAHMYT